MAAVAAARKRRVRAAATKPLMGVAEPRLGTPPKRKLTDATSKGFACIRFAERLGVRLFPWQKLALIRALELNPDGSYRFRVVLILVARQNGKTTLLKILTLWRMLEDDARLVVGTSTNMSYARDAWAAAVDLAQERDLQAARRRAHSRLVMDDLDDGSDVVKRWLPARERWVQLAKYGALDTSLKLTNGAVYKTATAGRTGGRSLSIDLGLADELREHRQKGEQDTGWEGWAAMDGATTARPKAQMYGLSNAGDDGSIVLNTLRASALAFIEDGEGDDTLCLLEWSGEDGCDVWDRKQWARANPALGHGTISEATLASKANLPATVFRPEHLCQGVPALRAAIQEAHWTACKDPSATLAKLRSRVAVTLDVAPDFDHVSLIAAAVDDSGVTRLDVLGAWPSLDAAFADGGIPAMLRKVKPKKIGWFPNGPAAAAAPHMQRLARKFRGIEPLDGVGMSSACQGLVEQVKAGRVRHSGDPMLTAHVLGANKQVSGDGFRFVRRGAANVDGAYAAAGAVFLARTIPRRKSQGLVSAA